MTIPQGNPGDQFPVVFHLHGWMVILISLKYQKCIFAGAGGQGNTNAMGHFLHECIQVAPDGYAHTWCNNQ